MGRVFFICHRNPYGIYDGKNIRLYNFARLLSKHYRVDLVCQEKTDVPKGIEDPFDCKYYFPLSKGKYFLNTLKSLFLYRSLVYRYMDPELAKFVSEKAQPGDVIYCTYIHTALQFINLSIPGVQKIVDLVDAVSLHFKEVNDGSIWRRLYYRLECKKVLELEKKVIQSFDQCLITAEAEKKYLLSNLRLPSESALKINVLANGVECPEKPATKERRGGSPPVIAFLGRMDYYPNIIAARILVEEIYPKCKNHYPKLECRIIGACPVNEVKSLEKYVGVSVTGFVENLEAELSQVDVVVLPMTIASGIQNKMITAMGYGKPTIVTPRANFDPESLVDGHNLLIADTPQKFVEKIIGILNDEPKSHEIGKNASAYIKSKLSWGNIEEYLVSMLHVKQ